MCDYNGWTNKETWACALRLTNVESMYSFTEDLLKAARKEAIAELTPKADIKPFHISNNARMNYIRATQANKLKEWVEEIRERVFKGKASSYEVGMIRETGSLFRVNFEEIVASIEGDFDDEEDENYTPSILTADDRPYEDY